MNVMPQDMISSRLKRRTWLLAFDRDGTLAPLSSRPEEACVSARAKELLSELSRLPDTLVAIVSARACRHLIADFENPRMTYCGNYGLEMVLAGGRELLHPVASRSAPSIALLRSRLEELFREIPGLLVDDHGLSLCLHYHQVEPSRRQRLGVLLNEFLVDVPGLKLHALPTSYEVLPNTDWDKARAFDLLAQQLQLDPADTSYFYAGDSDADEPAFRWVNAREGLTIRVGATERTEALQTVLSIDTIGDLAAHLYHARRKATSTMSF